MLVLVFGSCSCAVPFCPPPLAGFIPPSPPSRGSSVRVDEWPYAPRAARIQGGVLQRFPVALRGERLLRSIKPRGVPPPGASLRAPRDIAAAYMAGLGASLSSPPPPSPSGTQAAGWPEREGKMQQQKRSWTTRSTPRPNCCSRHPPHCCRAIKARRTNNFPVL